MRRIDMDDHNQTGMNSHISLALLSNPQRPTLSPALQPPPKALKASLHPAARIE